MDDHAGGRHVLVLGGAGYVGSTVTPRLLEAGRSVRVLDALLYGSGSSLAAVADHPRFSFERGDIRSRDDLGRALEGISDVILLAGLVGDPVCKRNPVLAREINIDGCKLALQAASDAGVERLVFASTCSNYGLRETDEPATEDDDLRPLSFYSESKVEIERQIFDRADELGFAPTVLRVSTAYGTSPRMRFDLTVSEFTRELALGRTLEVYDADTWRPYCHVADIAAAIETVLGAPATEVAGEVFNVGGDEGNYTKRSIVAAVSEALESACDVSWVEGGVDARNYRVSFRKIKERLGFVPGRSLEGSVGGLVTAVRAGFFGDVDARPRFYGNDHELAAASVAPGKKGTGVDAG